MPEDFKRLSADQARDFITRNRQGSYTLLDVRQPWEYQEMHIPGAQLVPLGELPNRLDELDTNKPVIAYCRSGGRSSAASGIMAGQGFAEVYNLDGGIGAWMGEPAVGPPHLGLTYIRGGDVSEILGRAWAMEHNLAAFYRDLAGKQQPGELPETLEKLAAMEDRHKRSVEQLHKNLTGDPLDTAAPHDMDALEGGMPAKDFLEANPHFTADPLSAVETAMAFEAQAMDLYMRFRAELDDPQAVKAVTALAQEEKNHLRTLARMLDTMGAD